MGNQNGYQGGDSKGKRGNPPTDMGLYETGQNHKMHDVKEPKTKTLAEFNYLKSCRMVVADLKNHVAQCSQELEHYQKMVEFSKKQMELSTKRYEHEKESYEVVKKSYE